MTVKELIEKLETMNPNAMIVEYNQDDSEYFPADAVKYTCSNQKYVVIYTEGYYGCDEYIKDAFDNFVEDEEDEEETN